VPDDRPRVPDATAWRLKECVDVLRGDINPGFYTLDATVEVGKDGHVVDVETNGVSHVELGICARMALRTMTVPADLLE